MNDRGKVADEANPNGEECEEGENGKISAPIKDQPTITAAQHRPPAGPAKA